MKINYLQLPVKVHYFFFMAAMGPILPFLPVYAKQLGVSSVVMGSVTAILPIFFLIAKPCFGFLMDYFRKWRKSIFIALLATTSGCYIFLNFLPPLPGPVIIDHTFNQISCDSSFSACKFLDIDSKPTKCDFNKGKETTCHWHCKNGRNYTSMMHFSASNVQVRFTPNTTCFLHSNETIFCQEPIICNVTCEDFKEGHCLYTSLTFWGFILLMSLGNIGFNVSNSVSDAICFDVLGNGGEMGYGRQRVWGTIGFGLAALIAGYAVDRWSQDQPIKVYTPAFILVLIFSVIDLLCCSKLQLPDVSRPSRIINDVYKLLKSRPIIIFLCFATLAGILDSFLIYFLFWYLEDLAVATNYMQEIKFIEGLIVAAETLGGEILFFSLSGRIIKKFGYEYSFVFCFACYALRLGAISLAPSPWWILPIELFMQGPTYALCYTTIVAYASAIAPPGASATVQGIVAGMDDGFGFAIGGLIGGILYKEIGGVSTLRFFASLAGCSSIIYYLLHVLYLKRLTPDMCGRIEWKTPDDAVKECASAADN